MHIIINIQAMQKNNKSSKRGYYKKRNIFSEIYHVFWKDNTPQQRLNIFLGLLFFGWLLIFFINSTSAVNNFITKDKK